MTENERDVRIGNPERSDALNRLTDAFVNGYVDITEFDERSAALAQATHRGQLDAVFADLPQAARENTLNYAEQSAFVGSAEAELDQVLDRGRKARTADAIIGTITAALFFLGLFVFHWPYFWVVFPLSGAAFMATRAIIGVGHDDEKIYDELEAAERKQRAQRLRVALERRKELGHSAE
ncbi:DUF1707 domain-containing protein [Corynebacterium liangguodongii]|uniref:DUF1707 domain-containing protein n=1 Tax=Corynebacterium liangguodongii TaxID=2079535 RepID=A0A2S0WCI2_9CORY|nr:DUF1707 domain-containing protein [Corynebacterium liangguodongii]AWB83392.1 DUF1707 domain-containing protein [Corynebacterium liangguodongii]PWC00518.1 DUF1707 domain-containing protein [Corynebacterium liangguodongii]